MSDRGTPRLSSESLAMVRVLQYSSNLDDTPARLSQHVSYQPICCPPCLLKLNNFKVRIDITDENDSPPKFDRAEYTAVLLLPTYADVAVVQVNASDPDTGVDTVLR